MNSLKIFLTALTCLFLLIGSVNADVVINEVELDPLGGAASDEWIELYNTDGSSLADISGYIISDLTKNNTIPNGTEIGPNGFLVLTKDLPYFNLQLNDNGEILTLKDNMGGILDITPEQVDNFDNLSTWQRIPDASDNWDFLEETKGESNDGTGGEIPEFPTFILPVLLMLASLSLARKHMPQGL